jgi:hypothetical protein
LLGLLQGKPLAVLFVVPFSGFDDSQPGFLDQLDFSRSLESGFKVCFPLIQV